MGPHLQHHDAGPLTGVFPLLPLVALHLVIGDEHIHRQPRDDRGEYGEVDAILLDLEHQGKRGHDEINRKRCEFLPGEPLPAAEHQTEINQQHEPRAEQAKRIQGLAAVQVVRTDHIVKPCELG